MYRFKPMGDKGVLISFKQEISPDTAARINFFINALEKKASNAIVEAIPAYAGVCVVYNPLLSDYGTIIKLCENILNEEVSKKTEAAQVYEIPVLYNMQTGPDLEFVAEHNNITIEEVIKIHTSKAYLIYMLGFAPGFCYLGGMDEHIATPRKQVPRQKIIAGSVGIAGSQTGMYPIESPGGWQLIGITPLKLYDPMREPPVYYGSGDYIKYRAIDENEFNQIKVMEESGQYTWVCKPY